MPSATFNTPAFSATATRAHQSKLPGARAIHHSVAETMRTARLDEQARLTAARHQRAIDTATAEHDIVRARAERTMHEQHVAFLRRQKKEQYRLAQAKKKAAEMAAEEEQLRLAREQEEERELIERERQLDNKTRKAMEMKSRYERLAEREAYFFQADAGWTGQGPPRRRQQADPEDDQTSRIEELQDDDDDDDEPQRAPKAIMPAAKVNTTTNAKTTATTTNTAATQQAVATPPAPTKNPTAIPTPTARDARDHKLHLMLHAKLKKLRQDLVAAKQQFPNLKQDLGDLKREVRKRMSQFSDNKAKNGEVRRMLIDTIRSANSVPGPTVDAQQFIVQPFATGSEGVDNPRNAVPALRIFLLNIMVKSAVQQMIVTAGPKLEAADAIGLACISVFSDAALRWEEMPLSSILMAKLHHTMPVLFGINGNEATDAGRSLIGWAREPHAGPGEWLPEHSATEKWLGIGAGFAACTLRIYKSSAINPLPPQLFWQAMSGLLNTPAHERTQAHFFLLKAFVDFGAPKIVGIFGQAGKAILDRAVTSFPRESQDAKGASALASSIITVGREFDLILD